jgi:ankyrin repeat protein
VRRLLQAGAEVGTKSATGATALHAAALMGHVSVVVALLAEGADADAVDLRGNTALVRAPRGDSRRGE